MSACCLLRSAFPLPLALCPLPFAPCLALIRQLAAGCIYVFAPASP